MSMILDFTVQRGGFTLSINTEILAGSVVAVLGPNGAGKTTLLRSLAGLDTISTGIIRIGERVVDDGIRVFVEPRSRSIGLVFQDYALFPHLSVLENVAFGPRSQGRSRTESRLVARARLEQLGIVDLAERKPAEISGGQAQRVALARAQATDPQVLLLDEPLAALDAQTHAKVRTELQRALSGFAGCIVLVTHDPLDAMLLADRIIVLENGRIVQDGPTAAVARQPATEYVAALMGVTLLSGTASDGEISIDGGGSLQIADRSLEGRARAVIRPSSVSLHRERPEGSARNVWRSRIAGMQIAHDRVLVTLDGPPSLVAAVTGPVVAELGLAVDQQVWVSIKALEVETYSAPE